MHSDGSFKCVPAFRSGEPEPQSENKSKRTKSENHFQILSVPVIGAHQLWHAISLSANAVLDTNDTF